jgi:hypothetical protein
MTIMTNDSVIYYSTKVCLNSNGVIPKWSLTYLPKKEGLGNLLDAEVGLTQIVADVLQHLFCYPLVGGLA